MPQLIVRRLLVSLPLLLVVSMLTFALADFAPGDTVRTILGDNYTHAGYERLRHQLGLDQPLVVQYGRWLSKAVRGDLGVSPISGLNVAAEVGNRLGVTASLAIGATLVAAVVGVGLGVAGAVRRGWLGRVVDVLALIGFALPSFWLGLVLVTLFAVMTRVLPATGYVSPTEGLGAWVGSLVLPVTALAAHGTTVIAKQTRDGMSEVMSRDFVYALRARGVPEVSVVLRHALRNAAIPVVTVIGLIFVQLLSGTVLVEAVFAMPGLGGLAVQASTQHDLPTLQGVVVTFTLLVVAANLLVDLAYGWLNPKVRIQ
jgi:peptide/nickel transport system permease protein